MSYSYTKNLLYETILPYIFIFVSIIQMIRTNNEFPNYYHYEIVIIIIGVVIGTICLSYPTYQNVSILKHRKDITADPKGRFVLIPFLAINILMILFFSPAKAWAFSVGFFIPAILPYFIAKLNERKVTFWVREESGETILFVKSK